MRRLRSSPRSIGWPLALLVVIVVSAASATAAQKLTGRDVVNGSLTGADVRNSSLGGADIRNRSLTPRDFRESIRGLQGPPGPPGEPGRNFAQLSGIGITDPPVVIGPGSLATVRAFCPVGSLAISGGHLSEPPLPIFVLNSVPGLDPATNRGFWDVDVANGSATDEVEVAAIAVCAPRPSTTGLRSPPEQLFEGLRDRRRRLEPGRSPGELGRLP
jgi:hypothetical protein